ncbi:MAG: FadR/GntR family transcriptional regulator [Methyloligellaceae bacterium]
MPLDSFREDFELSDRLNMRLRDVPATDDDTGSGRGANAITGRLRDAIETGVFADGDKLPPERDLATSFGSARSTVRKALDQLEAEGLLSRKVGSGTFVTYSEAVRGQTGEISDLISPLQLIEARSAIEPYIARLAAIHATQRDLSAMEAVLLKLEGSSDDKDLFTRLDADFHLSIARCARNPLLFQVYEHINDVRGHALWGIMKDKILSREQMIAYNAQHLGIFEAIKRRDTNAIPGLIREHLEKARDDLVGADSG